MISVTAPADRICNYPAMHWLSSILRERGKSQAELAKAIGVPPPRLTEMKRGRWRFPLDKIGPAAAFLGLSEKELLALVTGRAGDTSTVQSLAKPAGDVPPAIVGGDLPDDMIVTVPRYDARLSAGPGSLINGDEALGAMPFEAQWLRSITTTDADRLAVVMVDGDSMETTLSDRDLILIDRSQNRIGREGLYALRIGDYCWIKRLSLNLRDRMIRIISDNPRYPVQELPEEDVAILGRAVSIVARRL